MVTAVTTTTRTDTLAPFNGRHQDRCQDGTLWAALIDATAGTMTFTYSKDNGATWTAATGSSFGGGLRPDRGSSLFIDADDYAHIVFSDGSADLSYRRGTPNTGRTAWTWSAPLALQGINPGIIVALPDLVAHRNPTGSGWFAHVVACSLNVAVPAQSTTYDRISITAGGAFTHTGMLIITSNGTNDYPNAAGTYPSIDFRHTGDGKTVAGAPDLFVGWRAGQTGPGYGVRFRKALFSGGAWTWNPEREVTNLRGTDGVGRWQVCQFDGTRVSIVGVFYNGSTDVLAVYDRDAADTTTTISYEQPAGAGSGRYLAGGSASYDQAGNIYLFGGYNANNGLMSYKKYDRAAGTMGVVTQISALAPPTAGASCSVKRGYQPGSSIEVLFLTSTSSPYTVQYDRTVDVNRPPLAPTGLVPDSAVTLDRTIPQTLRWTANDPDSGDSTSKHDLRYRITGTTTWTTVTATTPNSFHEFPGATFPAGDYEWQVRTYDALGLVGPWSASAFFTAATPPAGPTITSPASGATIPSATQTVTISYPTLTDLQWRVLGDLAGVADTSNVINAGATISDPTARSFTATGLPNGTTVHPQVRVQNGGLWSPWVDSTNPVSYTPPAAPEVLALPNDPAATIVVGVTNPTPTGSQPTVIRWELWRRAGTSAPIRLFVGTLPTGPLGRQFIDYTPASGVDYAYRVVAFGDNATSTTGAWSDTSPLITSPLLVPSPTLMTGG